MNRKVKWALLIGIIVLMLAGWWYVRWSVERVSVVRFGVTGVKDASLSSFTLAGDLFLKNPGRLSVPVEAINYAVVLNETGSVLSSGKTESFTLEAGAVTRVPVEFRVELAGTIGFALLIATEPSVPARIEGNVSVTKFDYAVPFEKTVDLKRLLAEKAIAALGRS